MADNLPPAPGIHAGTQQLRDSDDRWRRKPGSEIVTEGALTSARRAFNGKRSRRKAGADGFVPWAGGEIPVEPTDKVAVQYRSGFLLKDGTHPAMSAFRLRWKHAGADDDIVGYKIIDLPESA